MAIMKGESRDTRSGVGELRCRNQVCQGINQLSHAKLSHPHRPSVRPSIHDTRWRIIAIAIVTHRLVEVV